MTASSERTSADRLEWPIVILAACFHADRDVRSRLRDRCEDVLANLGTRYRDDEVRGCLQAQEGTVLEPLLWTKSRLDLAVFLVRILFSDKVGATRVRIASTEAEENEYGLVLTNNLRAYFTERYVFGKRRNPTIAAAALHPGRLPRNPGSKPFWAGAPWPKPGPPCLQADDQGLAVILPWYGLGDGREVGWQFQEYSRIRGCDEPFSQLGLRVEAAGSKLVVLTGSPEAHIRFMAHAMNGDVLELRGGRGDPYCCNVELTAPAGKRTTLRGVVTADGLYLPWLDSSIDIALRIPDEDKRAIATWYPPPSAWHRVVGEIDR